MNYVLRSMSKPMSKGVWTHVPRLELLEARLPPGEILHGALWGTGLGNAAWSKLNPQSRGSEPGLHVVQPRPIDEFALTHVGDRLQLSGRSELAERSRLSEFTPSAQGALSSTLIEGFERDALTSQVETDVLASPFPLWGRGALVRHRATAGTMQSQSLAERVTAPMSVSPVRPSSAAIAKPTISITATAIPAGFTSDASPQDGTVSAARKEQIAEQLGELPLSFEQNVGQFDDRVDFVARAGGYTAFVTPTAMVMTLPGQRSEVGNRGTVIETQHSALSTQHSPPGAALYMQVVGGNPAARAAGISPLSGKVNYFIGNDPSQWHANIATFSRVEYDDVYPGIDLIFYGNGEQLEYDFIVSPGVDPNQIALNFAGADSVETNAEGDLILHTALGDVVQQKPFTYQEVGNTRQEVATRYLLDGTQVRFEIGAHDPSQPLVIDPLVLGYSTFLGGSNADFGWGIAVDAGGNAYVTGRTNSGDFPTTPGAFDTSYNGGFGDVFVAKLGADGAGLLYSTYLGGSGSNEDAGFAIAVDSSGNAYVTGNTGAGDFPTTPDAFDITFNGGAADAFVTKLSPDGSRVEYSTFLGGVDNDFGKAIGADGSGNAYVTGVTASTNFPTTEGAFDTIHGFGDAFVTKLRADGAGLRYSTYLGGSQSSDDGVGIAVDGSGNAYVTGHTQADFPTTPGAFDTTYNGGPLDGFLTKLNPAGSDLVYSTFLGGSQSDNGAGISVDGSGVAYVTGATGSSDFPITSGSFDTSYNGTSSDAFITKVSADGSGLVYSTYLGGSAGDAGVRIAVHGSGDAYVMGATDSSNFPTTPDAFKRRNRGTLDVFVTKLNASGTAIVYATYLGAPGSNDFGFGFAVDTSGSAYVTGYTETNKFPTTQGAFDTTFDGPTDAFVTKFRNVPLTAKGDV